jgi:threonine dehydrogenase-like Zn-dependent dehydrogenase
VVQTEPGGQPIPGTEHAIQIVDAGRVVHNRAKAVPIPGPHQILVRMEACGICFSDTKLLHAFTSHPRKSEVLSGLDPAVLADIPSYVPGELPAVPGHEPVGRIVAVGGEVEHHRVGERCLIQTDYRHLLTAASNAAFGYNFEGGLQEYVLLDERVIMDPDTGERFLIPVSDGPSASAVALVEPWACVEASYVYRERRTPLRAGRLLVVADAGHSIEGLERSDMVEPARVTAVVADARERELLERAGFDAGFVDTVEALGAGTFDDIVYFGASPDRIEQLQERLGSRGLINVVTGGVPIGRSIALDIGRVHYDLTRWTGTTGTSAAAGYAAVPEDGELRDRDRCAVIGAAGPMGLMHVVRAALAGLENLFIVAVDIDDTRLERLDRTAGPMAGARHVAFTVVNSRVTQLSPGFSYIALMVPAPPLVNEAVELAGDSCRINVFAGFAANTRAEVDLDRYLARGCYFVGTSGSTISDMRAVLRKLEAGELDTNISLDAVAGFEGVGDALAAVESRTSVGKIVVYPALPDLGTMRLRDLAERYPTVGAAMGDGRWTRAAEQELLRVAGQPRP